MLVLLLDSVTLAPPEGAAVVSVTVQVEVPGALTVAGEQLSEAGTVETVRLIVVVWFCPFKVAVTVALCALPMVPAVAVKVALLFPEDTDTLAGTVSRLLLLLRVTVVALVAALFRDTVQVLEALLARADGAHETDEIWAGAVALSVKVCEVLLSVAVSTAV